MNLIYHRGLNCHLASIINIAAALGIEYQKAFSNLWSEQDFKKDTQYHIYTSGRVLVNLAMLGLETDELDCTTPTTAANGLSALPEEELLLIGMDTFYIPWSHVYQHFHEAHYFFVRKESADTYSGFDPTYQKNNQVLRSGQISDHAFDISRIRSSGSADLNDNIVLEAKNIVAAHPEIKQNLLNEINKFTDRQRTEMKAQIQLISAMINNRYLFQQYFQHTFDTADTCPQIFDNAYLAKWEGVKNGLNKAYILKDNANVIAEVSERFRQVMEAEILMATTIIDKESEINKD